MIHARSEPYRGKFVLCRRGTAQQPILIEGVPGPRGELPVIDGRDAKTRKELNFWGEDRAVIKIGGANRPKDLTPAHIILRRLEIRSGRRPYFFTGRSGRTAYRKNAASIYIEKGEHILIDHCRLRDSGNGIITAPATRHLTVSRCHIFDNGVEKSLYEHNAYISALHVTFKFNRFGPLRSGCPGNNFKDRSAGLNFFCNWVEGGNRCLDLVDASAPILNTNPNYTTTMVWGNVLLKGDGGNNQVIHFGGDSGNTKQYRRRLMFYNNTVVSHRRGNTVLVRRSSDHSAVGCLNNIIYVDPRSGRLNLQDRGTMDARYFLNNWLSQGWRQNPGSRDQGSASRQNFSGRDPGFVDLSRQDFRLVPASPCRGRAREVMSERKDQPNLLNFEYVPHQGGRLRNNPNNVVRDLGAFAFQL